MKICGDDDINITHILIVVVNYWLQLKVTLDKTDTTAILFFIISTSRATSQGFTHFGYFVATFNCQPHLGARRVNCPEI